MVDVSLSLMVSLLELKAEVRNENYIFEASFNFILDVDNYLITNIT